MALKPHQVVERLRALGRTNRIRLVVLGGTILVTGASVALVVAAYSGNTLGLGSGTDKATAVNTAVAVGIMLLALVASVLALFAYWEATGEPDLAVEVSFRFSELNKPRFLVEPADNIGWIPLDPYEQVRASVVVRNASRYAARNPSVGIRLVGMARGVYPSDSGYSDDWECVTFINTVGYVEFLWDGGADRMIHGLGTRRLPDFTLYRARIMPNEEPRIEVVAYADGTAPVWLSLPVETYTRDTPQHPEEQS